MALLRSSRTLANSRAQRSIYGDVRDRKFKILSVVSVEPGPGQVQPGSGIEGNFLSRENGFILATSDDKLIEFD
jgi:hypothetical protein